VTGEKRRRPGLTRAATSWGEVNVARGHEGGGHMGSQIWGGCRSGEKGSLVRSMVEAEYRRETGGSGHDIGSLVVREGLGKEPPAGQAREGGGEGSGARMAPAAGQA